MVNDWHTRNGDGKLEGKIEFIQETEWDLTSTEVDIRGLKGLARGYHVHMVSMSVSFYTKYFLTEIFYMILLIFLIALNMYTTK